MPSRVAVVIPAYNEEKTLARTLRLLGRLRIPMDVIVVNDGSTDRTAQVARRYHAHVVEFIGKGGEVVEELDGQFQPSGYHKAKAGEPINRGKGNAMLAGLRVAMRMGATTTITMDADMISIPKDHIEKIINETNELSKRREIRTLLFGQRERENESTIGTHVTGIRAYTLPALHYILKSKNKRSAKRFGLEPFLNHTLRNRIIEASWMVFDSEKAFRSGHSTWGGQKRDVTRAESILKKANRRNARRKFGK